MRLSLLILAALPLAAQTCSITSPANNAHLVNTNAVQMTASLTAAPSVERIDWYIDGELRMVTKARDTWRWVYPAKVDPDSTHVVRIVCLDALGAQVDDDSVTFRVQNAGGRLNVTYSMAKPLSGLVVLTFTTPFSANPQGSRTVSIDGLGNHTASFGTEVWESLYGVKFAYTDIDEANDWINVSGHGFYTGQLLRFVTASDNTGWPADPGKNPPGCNGSNCVFNLYYAVVVNTNRIRLATNHANVSTCEASGANCVALAQGDAGSYTFEGGHNLFIGDTETMGPGTTSMLFNTRRLRNGDHILYAHDDVTIGNATNTSRSFAPADVNTTNGEITMSGHVIKSGQLMTLSNSGGALPTGLAAATNYYGCWKTDNTFTLYTAQAAAEANHAVCTSGQIIPSTQGSGTHSYTATLEHPGYDKDHPWVNSVGYRMVDFQDVITISNTNTLVEIQPQYYFVTCTEGQTRELAPVVGVDSEGDRANITTANAHFRSNDTSVATVNASGTISCVNGPGFAVVWTTYMDQRAETLVWVQETLGFPHYQKTSGPFLTSYDPAKSRFIVVAEAMGGHELNNASSEANRIGGKVGKEEAVRAGFNTFGIGPGSNVSNSGTLAVAQNLWNGVTKPDLVAAINNTGFGFVCGGDDVTNDLPNLIYNVGWDRRAFFTQVLDETSPYGGCIYYANHDEVDGAFGPDPQPCTQVGCNSNQYFAQIVVTGCASPPCVGTGTVTLNNWSFGLTATTSIVRLYGATSQTALNKHYQLATPIAGGTFTVKTIDVPNGTYNATSDPGMNLVFNYFRDWYGYNSNGISISVSGDTATGTLTSHGFSANNQSICIGNVTTDTDLNGCWTIASTPTSSTFTFGVRNVSAGTYSSATDASVIQRVTTYGALGPLTGDIWTQFQTLVTSVTPAPSYVSQTVGGGAPLWLPPNYGTGGVKLNVTTVSIHPMRNRGSSYQAKRELVERALFVKSRRADLPIILQGGWTGREYYKQAPAGECLFQPGVDRMSNVGDPKKFGVIGVMGAVALGSSGIQGYYYDGVTFKIIRCNGAPGHYEQYPFSLFKAGPWEIGYAIARPLRFIKRFESYAVSPRIGAPNLGPWFMSGCQERSGAGRLCEFINSSEVPITQTIPISSFKYGNTNQVYRITNARMSVESLADAATATYTFKPGEAIGIFFPAAEAEQSLATRTFSYTLPTGGTKAILYTNYIYWDDEWERDITPFDCGSSGSCGVTVDRNLGDFLYRWRFTSADGRVIAESDVMRLE